MLYTRENLENARARTRRECAISFGFLGLGLIATVAALILRLRVLASAGVIAGGMVCYFYYSLKAAPWRRYAKHLGEIFEGIVRESEGLYDGVSSEGRTVDGVAVKEFYLIDPEAEKNGENRRLFYWDEALPLPEIQAGQRLQLSSYGRFVVGLQKIA